MVYNIWSNKSCTHRFLLAPVHSYWGTTQTCRWSSLPTSPPPPAGSRWWCRPWRMRVRPHWSAGRESVPWPARGHTHCPLTCPEKEEDREDGTLFTSRGQRGWVDKHLHYHYRRISVLYIFMVTHQAAVLRLQQFRRATLSVQRVKWLDPQCCGVRYTHTVPRNT